MLIDILLLEFLRFPSGSLWEHFGVVLGSIGDLEGPFGSLWVPLGSLWDHFGGPWPPLGTMLDDFGIVLGPSDWRKGPKGDEERFWAVCCELFKIFC